jgi:flagellin-specific chaperone FliS
MRLLMANRNADDLILAEVASIINTLRDGWSGIAPKAMPARAEPSRVAA